MKSIAYDTQLITEDKFLNRFFEDEDFDDLLVNNKLEKDILKFLFHPVYKFYNYLIFDELAVKDYHYFLEVREPVINKSDDKPGDIDLLLIPNSDPSISIAFQVKKIKGFLDYKNRKELINVKTSGISEGIKRSNKMFRNFRFHQNYLLLIIANDGQSFDPDFFDQEIKDSQIEPAYNLNTYQSLNNDIGIFIVEITRQAEMNSTIKGMISSGLFRKSSLIAQALETTKRIQSLVNQKK